MGKIQRKEKYIVYIDYLNMKKKWLSNSFWVKRKILSDCVQNYEKTF